MHEDTTLTAVAAIAENNAIANNGQLPWDTLPKDEEHYTELVQGKPIIVGRRTYEDLVKYMTEIAEASPIAVLTTTEDYETEYDQHTTIHDKDTAIEWITQHDEVYNLGGGSVYNLLFPETDTLVISHIPLEPEADTYFPRIPQTDWTVINQTEFENFTVKTYKRKSNTQSEPTET